MVFLGLSMDVLGFCRRLPVFSMAFLGLSMVFLGFSDGFPWVADGFPWVVDGLCCRFSLVVRWFALGFR